MATPACSGTDDGPVSSEDNASLRTLRFAWDLPDVTPCAETRHVNLANAAWAVWFSGNAYVHLNEVAPELERVGFGNVGDGARWQAEFAKLREARERKDLSREERAALTTHLENELVRGVHPDRRIEFFSGGDVVLGSQGEALFDKRSTQVMFAHHRTLPIVFIAFRGTEIDELDDLHTDIKVLRVSRQGLEPGASVHRGFRGAVDQVHAPLDTRLNMLPKGTEVIITGHSLGGALAVELASRLLADPRPVPFHVQGVYTFGAPRVGNEDYARQLTEAAKAHGTVLPRFQHGFDFVTNLPGEWLGYRHAGMPIHLREEGVFLSSLIPLGNTGRDHASRKYFDKLTRRFRNQNYPVLGEGDYAGADALSHLEACGAAAQ